MWEKSICAKSRGLLSRSRGAEQLWRTPAKWLLANSSSNGSSRYHLHYSTDAPHDRHQCGALSLTMIKTDFGAPLLLPSLESSIQMQIALNPINPFRHLYESVSVCVCLDAFIHIHNSPCAHTFPSILSFREKELKLPKNKNMYFPGYFVRCSCVHLINISYQIFNIIPSPIGSALKCSSKWILP